MRLPVLILALLVCTAVMAGAAVPPMISYQGKLMQPSGAPVPDGTYSMVFAIYDAPTGGTPLWSETNPNVQVKGGLFAVMLGSVINLPANIFDSPNRWFGIKVGNDPEMSPRQRVASVAYAQVAGTVPSASITSDRLAPGVATPSGTVSMYAGSTAPEGWLLCNGQAVSRVQYAVLFATIGTTYGAGDGSTTFGLPDTRGRFPIGQSTGYLLASAGGSSTKNLQHVHATQDHVLSWNEMPSHNHGAGSLGIRFGDASGQFLRVIGLNVSYNGGFGVACQSYGMEGGDAVVVGNTSDSGGNAAHNHGDTTNGLSTTQDVLNPFISFNYIIKL